MKKRESTRWQRRTRLSRSRLSCIESKRLRSQNRRRSFFWLHARTTRSSCGRPGRSSKRETAITQSGGGILLLPSSFYIRGAGETPAPQPEGTTARIVVQSFKPASIARHRLSKAQSCLRTPNGQTFSLTFPSLNNRGATATGHGGGGSNGRGKANQIRSRIAATRTTPVAPRDRRRCAPHPLPQARGGEFSCNLPDAGLLTKSLFSSSIVAG